MKEPTATDAPERERDLLKLAAYLRRQGEQTNRQQPIVPVAGSELLKAADELDSIASMEAKPDPEGDSDDEHFLVAYVSKNTRVIGIDHPTEASWDNVLNAHIALRDRLNVRIREQDKCPFNAALAAKPSLEPIRTELVEALLGPDGDDGSCGRLGWLFALLAELKQLIDDEPGFRKFWEGNDPDAAWECLNETARLANDLRTLLSPQPTRRVR